MTYITTDVIDDKQISISNHLPDLGIDNIRKEIIESLSSEPKFISSKFFYDDRGSRLFEKITNLPEYYPTRTEKSILKKIAPDLMKDSKNISIVELGSGDHSKINILLSAIKSENLKTINYVPIDVSHSAIKNASDKLIELYPGIQINGLIADFIHQLDLIPAKNKRMFCFLGSTLGNFDENIANEFLKNLSSNMNPGDTFLLGLDLVKPVHILHNAYNDSQKVTAEFNKNILNNINEIIKSNLNPDDFEHEAFFNDSKSRIEMHLKATKDILVSSPYMQSSIEIIKGETMQTENSYKFSINRINEIADQTHLKIKEIFTDKNDWFALVHFIK
jgi:L-histidine N-alpha-methyltransferase